jgi:peptidoglycan/xylan/chitin deacetylase (PgdA/CDA1 family)
MSLPGDYLAYPRRRQGQDHSLYRWALATDRPKAKLASGARVGVALIVPLEFFMLNPSGKPFKHPGAMQTPYPDLRHYTTRDYGNRIGAFRLLDIFAAAGVNATFAVNAVLLDRVKPLIEAIIKDGHEIAAHGWDTDSIHWTGADPAAEEAFIHRTRNAFDAVGLCPRVWMSPARQQSFRTLDLIARAGFNVCLDWEVDTVPLRAETPSGAVTLFPLLNELDDRTILTAKNHAEDEWRDQILEAAAMTAGEFRDRGAQVFGVTLTPYVAGLPFRIWAVRDIVKRLKDIGEVSTVSALVDGFSS